MKLTLLILIFTIISYSSFSQKIKGTIIDKHTQQPVSGAHIYLKKF